EASIGTASFATRASRYQLKVRCHVKSGYLRLIVKHGNNSYSLFDQRLTATDGMKEYEFFAEETAAGGHASCWFALTGEVEVESLELTQVLSEAEQALAKQLTHTPPPELPELKIPDLSKVKLIMQEWHLWFHADIPESGKDAMWQAWGVIHGEADYYTASGPLWRRGFNDKIYPYLGPYSAVNKEIIRWQVQVMKNSGLDGTTCQMYPEQGKGEVFCNLEVFEECVKAGEEFGYGIAVHDEIQFMPASAKGVDAFINRAYSALKLAKKYPRGYLRIDGKPLYQYEAWGLDKWTAADHRRMMQAVEAKLGEPVYWMVCGPPEALLPVEEFSALKSPADTWVWLRPEESTAYGASADFRWNPGTLLPFYHPEFTKRFDDAVAKYMKITADANRKRKNPVDLVPWLYNSFDSGTIYRDPSVGTDSTYDRKAYIIRSVNAALKANPRIINLSAWNERREKTSWEPSWHNEDSDPFCWVKLIAAMKGVEFKEPPLPPKESVDKMMWGILYGIDGTPPVIRDIRAHISEASVSVDAVDDGGKVADIRLSASPLCFVDCTAPLREFGCSTNVTADEVGMRIPAEGSVTIRLDIGEAAGNVLNPWFAYKYTAPDGFFIRVKADYPREQEYTVFRLNGWQIPNAVAGPYLWGTGKSEWQTFLMHRLQLTPEKRRVTLNISVSRLPGVPADPNARIYLESIAVYPNEILNDSIRGAELPNVSENLCTRVMEMPYRLLPRNFFDIPLAVQAVDDSGNFSGVSVFDLTPKDRLEAPGVIQKKPAGRVWR
ncbi:MAG: hypothetical protein J6S21_01275, partial [Victivallales bacterium]|nr:hypothetical protein [Victivallales bacterium]